MLRLDAIWFYVASLGSARDFYGNILDLSVSFEDLTTGWIEFRSGGVDCRLACQEWGKTPESVGKRWPEPSEVDAPHVVLSTADLDGFMKRLKAYGIVPREPRKIGSVRFLNVRDFDGNALQIVEKPRQQ